MNKRILRPLEFGDIIDETFDLYKKNFFLFAGISAVIILPIMLLQGLLYQAPNPSNPAAAVGAGITAILVLFLLVPGSYAIAGVTAWAVSQTYLGTVPTILDSYKAIRGRLLSFTWTMFATGLLTSLGTALCVAPGVYLALTYALVSPVFIIEGLGGGDARRRSGQLASGNYWRIFVVLLLAGIFNFIISALFQFGGAILFTHTNPFVPATGASVSTGAAVAASLLEGIGTCLATPIAVIAAVMLYYDIRVRKEGFDIELLAQSLGQGSTTSPSTEISG
jgi:hypothetical protein